MGLISLPFLSGAAPQAPSTAPGYKDLNTPREFPTISTRAQWEDRARDIREQVRLSCGLWPMPKKTPLKAHVFGRVEREGYSIEKVSVQTAPGFYLAGNLYRPLGRGKGPFPGVLNPHGHWKEGRLVDDAQCSVPARCINFARQGMVAFAYDMVGFNDTHFADAPTNRPFYEIHRQFGAQRTDELWSISLMGLQTWNSIRALDFLASLPDVDPKRLACTGASGGGTQTYILGAVDERLAAQAPVVMVSHSFQGGCSCENAPGLRVEYSNMEIAAAAAPRPQLLVGASGDWTRDMLTVEGPAVARVYELLGAPDRLRYVRLDFHHNYNQTSRETVYAWFDHWLLNQPADVTVKEIPCQSESESALRVFPDGQLPAGALTQAEFEAALKQDHLARWRALLPRNRAGLERFKREALPAWRHTLQVGWPASHAELHRGEVKTFPGCTGCSVQVQRRGENSAIQATYWAPEGLLTNPAPELVVLCGPEAAAADGSGQAGAAPTAPGGAVAALLNRGVAVLAVEQFSSGGTPNTFTNFFTTYNRTPVQEHVRDLLTLCGATGSLESRKAGSFHTVLIGTGRAGLWALLAAPGAEAVVADCEQFDPSTDEALLGSDVFCPGLRNIGTFEGAPMLAAPHPLLLHNVGANFPTRDLARAYQGVHAAVKLRVVPGRPSAEALADWVAGLRQARG